jgi:hypothetical protein
MPLLRPAKRLRRHVNSYTYIYGLKTKKVQIFLIFFKKLYAYPDRVGIETRSTPANQNLSS